MPDSPAASLCLPLRIAAGAMAMPLGLYGWYAWSYVMVTEVREWNAFFVLFLLVVVAPLAVLTVQVWRGRWLGVALCYLLLQGAVLMAGICWVYGLPGYRRAWSLIQDPDFLPFHLWVAFLTGSNVVAASVLLWVMRARRGREEKRMLNPEF